MYAIRSYYGSLTCFVLPVMMSCSGWAAGGEVAAVAPGVQSAVSAQLPALAEREELAQQLLELALADRITSYNVCYTKLLRFYFRNGGTGQRLFGHGLHLSIVAVADDLLHARD